MMDELTVPFVKSEDDALTGCRKWYGWKAGTIARIKRSYRKRCRQTDKRRVEQLVSDSPALPE